MCVVVGRVRFEVDLREFPVVTKARNYGGGVKLAAEKSLIEAEAALERRGWSAKPVARQQRGRESGGRRPATMQPFDGPTRPIGFDDASAKADGNAQRIAHAVGIQAK